MYVGFAEKVADADDIEREAVATARWGGGGGAPVRSYQDRGDYRDVWATWCCRKWP